MEFKAKLEGRLILCAGEVYYLCPYLTTRLLTNAGCACAAPRNTCSEVGQALLQRHEAYVRRHPRTDNDKTRLESEVELLRSQNASLEKVNPDYMLYPLTPLTSTNFALFPQRLARVLVNNEVSEASNNVVLQELQETRSNLSRLTTQHTKCVGIESRLARTTIEKEDLQQERDTANQRARAAETRVVTLRDRVSRLQEQLTTLHTELDQHRNHRLELSEEISQGARLQLEAWLQSKVSFACFSPVRSAFHASTINRTYDLKQAEPNTPITPITPTDEVTKILETLVTDNEMLKRDGEELQRLLSESREDFRVLQEELDELRASENRKYSRHHSRSSVQLLPLNLAPLSPQSTRSFSGGPGYPMPGKHAANTERNFYVSTQNLFRFSILNLRLLGSLYSDL